MFVVAFALIGTGIELTRSIRKIKEDWETTNRRGTYGRQLKRNLTSLAWLLPLILFGALLDWIFGTGFTIES